jgi:hypothetical protein
VSRGLGKLQKEVLATVEKHGTWIWAVDLVVTIYRQESDGTFPYSFYSSVRRAAGGLIRRKELCSGAPEPETYVAQHFRMAYWLPNQAAPAIRQTFSATLMDGKVLGALAASEAPLSFGDISGDLARQLKADRYTYERLKVPVHRSIARLLKAGSVQLVSVNSCGVTTKCYTTTVKSERSARLSVKL